MIKSSYLLAGMLILCLACDKTSEKQTPNGLKYTVIEKGDGTIPKKDDILVFDYQLKDSKDSVWGDTFKDGLPAASMIADTAALKNEDGMTQLFRQLSKGDSVKTTMSVKDFFQKLVKAPVPGYVDSARSVTYTIKVRDIMDLNSFKKYRDEKVTKRDDKVIDQFVKDNKIEVQKDTTGLQYIIYNRTGKAKPTVEKCVEVKYTGKFLKNGKIFDQNKVAFPLNQVIRAWQLGIPMLSVGDSATFFVPSRLAYGTSGYYGIPPDAVLMFDVHLLDIKEFDPATGSCK